MAADLARYDRAWWILRRTAGLLARVLLRPRVIGRRNVPAAGPVLIVSNHESWWDIPALGVSQPRTIRYMAKRELYDHIALAWLLAMGRRVRRPARRGRSRRAAERARDRSRPAGRWGSSSRATARPSSTAPRRARGGARSSRTAPVIPAAIRGTGSWRPGRRIGIAFGEPRVYERGDRRPGDAYRETADELMAEIRRLYELAG